MSSEEIIQLQPNNELQITVDDPSRPFHAQLLNGKADIFGSEMILNKVYSFRSSLSVLTFQGSTLQLSKDFYTKTRSVNPFVYYLHDQLENERADAYQYRKKGPVVLVVGPQDVGKSTLCKTLLNLAARSGRRPFFIDLDVGQSSISIPGTLSILPISSPSGIETGFEDSNIYVYFFGYKSPGFNIAHYYLLIDKMGQTVSYRLKKGDEVSASGAIIDACGWTTGQGYKSMLVAARSFSVNKVLVFDDRNLYSQLKQDLPRDVSIIFIDKLTGVRVRTKQERAYRRDKMIREYFYGSICPLKNFTFDVRFSDVQLFSVAKPSFNFSHGQLDEALKHISLEEVPITCELTNSILAVSYADSIDEDIPRNSVMGFICVKNVNVQEEVLTIISPQPAPLPKRILLKGDLQMIL